MGNAARALCATLVVVGMVPLTSGLTVPLEGGATTVLHGPEVAVGGGTARLFVEVGRSGEPEVLGIKLTDQALDGLAKRMNTTSRCWDKNGDGTVAHGECLGDYESVLTIPPEAETLALPIRWATVNWNPEGHLAPAPPVWSAAHFDFHFFLADSAVIRGIRAGPCAEFIHCDDFARAQVPLPQGHLPEGYVDVGAAVAGMGNHLVDSRDPELADIPTAIELTKTDEGKAVMTFLSADIPISRAYVTTPGVPAERVNALRRAFDATMKDPEFIAEAKKFNMDMSPSTGEEAQRYADLIANTPAPILARAKAIIESK